MNFENELNLMKQKVQTAVQKIDALLLSARSPMKFNTLVDSAMQQMELACIEMRRIVETIRPKEALISYNDNSASTIYGSVNLTKEGWVHIKLNTLLPHYKVLGGTQYISDSISRLLNAFVEAGNKLPCFDKAFLAIVEQCSVDCCEAYDSDNKGYKAVINSLKGRLFEDDNQFELSLGLFSVLNDENNCHIYVLPSEDASKFLWFKSIGGL